MLDVWTNWAAPQVLTPEQQAEVEADRLLFNGPESMSAEDESKFDAQKAAHTANYWAEYEAHQAALIQQVEEWLSVNEVERALYQNEWTLLTMGQLKKLPPPSFLVDDRYLVDGAINILSGSSMSFKSWLALHWAARLHVDGKRVVYFANEGARIQSERLDAWALHHGAEYPEIPVFVGAFDVVQQRREVIRMVGRADLIIIDTMRKATPSMSEDSSDDMTLVMAACDEIKRACRCAILLIDHTGHENKSRPRGSSVKIDAVDMGITMERSGKSKTVTVTNWKLKGGEEWGSEQWQLLETPAGPVLLPSEQVPFENRSIRGWGHRDALAKAIAEGRMESAFTRTEAAAAMGCSSQEASNRLNAGGAWAVLVKPGKGAHPAIWSLKENVAASDSDASSSAASK